MKTVILLIYLFDFLCFKSTRTHLKENYCHPKPPPPLPLEKYLDPGMFNQLEGAVIL